MRKIRPIAWVMIILNVWFLYALFTTLGNNSDEYYQTGALLGYMFAAGFINVVLYIIFRITEKRNK